MTDAEAAYLGRLSLVARRASRAWDAIDHRKDLRGWAKAQADQQRAWNEWRVEADRIIHDEPRRA